MTIKNLKYILHSFLLLTGLFSVAQQDPQYTQYMYNMSVINPAYATEGEDINVGALYRSQWVGTVGAPNTGTLFVHVPLKEKIQVSAKTRYSTKESKAIIYPIENGKMKVEFIEPQRAITPGQSIVFYDGDIVLGGGKIEI